jgi:hypothetical protein
MFLKMFLCWIGLHKWVTDYARTIAGISFGDKCARCGKWSSARFLCPYHDDDIDGGKYE